MPCCKCWANCCGRYKELKTLPFEHTMLLGFLIVPYVVASAAYFLFNSRSLPHNPQSSLIYGTFKNHSDVAIALAGTHLCIWNPGPDNKTLPVPGDCQDNAGSHTAVPKDALNYMNGAYKSTHRVALIGFVATAFIFIPLMFCIFQFAFRHKGKGINILVKMKVEVFLPVFAWLFSLFTTVDFAGILVQRMLSDKYVEVQTYKPYSYLLGVPIVLTTAYAIVSTVYGVEICNKFGMCNGCESRKVQSVGRMDGDMPRYNDSQEEMELGGM